MKLLCFDPGPSLAGAVLLDTSESPPKVLEIWPHHGIKSLLGQVYLKQCDAVVVEMITSYGMPMDNNTMRTLVAIGWIEEACRRSRIECHEMTRPNVCIELCGSTKATKANTSQAVRNRYPATGGGKKPEVGIKKKPGPLYGMTKHAWDALALGIAWVGKTAPR